MIFRKPQAVNAKESPLFYLLCQDFYSEKNTNYSDSREKNKM